MIGGQAEAKAPVEADAGAAPVSETRHAAAEAAEVLDSSGSVNASLVAEICGVRLDARHPDAEEKYCAASGPVL